MIALGTDLRKRTEEIMETAILAEGWRVGRWRGTGGFEIAPG